MASGGRELASLDFDALIGGPLSAIVRSQARAAKTSVDFIQNIGFYPADLEDEDLAGKPVMVTFEYDKAIEQPDGTITKEPYKLAVPLLTMLPVPFIRVEEATIDFNAKINSVTSVRSKRDTAFGVSAKVEVDWWWVSASLQTSYSSRTSTTAAQKTERTYTMAIHVRAVQDEIPAGTGRVLDILENAISEVPESAAA